VGGFRRLDNSGQYSRNFSEYEEWRKQQLGDAATRPHRITYRKLTR
jgi:hypothetical protein